MAYTLWKRNSTNQLLVGKNAYCKLYVCVFSLGLIEANVALMEGEDVYTVIPTAPEDVFDSSADFTLSPVLLNKPRPSPVSYSPKANQSRSKPIQTERNGPRTPKEGGRRKDGKLLMKSWFL